MKFKIDKISMLKELSDEQLAIAEVWVCCEGDNAHEMPITHNALVNAIPTLYNKFLVAGFDGSDFMGHEGSAQLILGFFPKESKIVIKKDDRGINYIVANAIISKIYAEWAYDIFDDGLNHRDVSMEIYVTDTEYNEEDDKTYITEFCFMGVTVLGLDHMPACKGAKIEITKFSDENVQGFVEEATSVYRHRIDFSNNTWAIPENIKNIAKRALELQEEYGFTYDSVSMATARYLSTHDTIDINKARHYKRYYPSVKGLQKLQGDNEITLEYVRYQLWGGVEGYEWLSQIFSELDNIDNTINRYFVANDTIVNNENNERKEALTQQNDNVLFDVENNAMNNEVKTENIQDNEVLNMSEDEVVEKTTEETVEFSEETTNTEEKEVTVETMSAETEQEIVENNSEKVEETAEETLTENFSDETEKTEEVENFSEENTDNTESKEEFSEEKAECEKTECEKTECEKTECEKVDCADETSEENKEEDGEITVEMDYEQLKADFEALKKECEELREFKASIENEKKNQVVMSTIMEVQDRCANIPMEELDSWKTDAQNFSFENIESWKEKVYSKAFMFSTTNAKKDDDITKMGLSFNNNANNNTTTKHEKRFVWDD